MLRRVEPPEHRLHHLGIKALHLVSCDVPFPVWLVTAPPQPSQGALDTLSQAERERADRFRIDKQRTRYIAAHAALRVMVERYFGIMMHRQVYGTTAQGKPHVAGFPQVQCSISYSDERALVAVAPGRGIGVDIERVREVEDAADIMQAHYTEEECVRLCAHAHEQQAFQRLFLAIWTRKEACVKAVGRGLSFPLSKVRCGADDGVVMVLIGDDQLHTGAIGIDDAYVASWAQAGAQFAEL